MKYKLVVVDMDGTLLNSSKRVSEENKNVLAELQNLGVIVAIATGRIYTTLKTHVKDLKIDAPVIACNGAVIRDINHAQTIFADPISMENCRRILAVCKEYKVDCYMYSEDTIYARRLEKLVGSFYDSSKTAKEEDKIKIEMMKSMEDVLDKGKAIYKFVIFSEDGRLVEKTKKKLKETLDLEICKSSADFLDVMNKGVCKGFGIKKLAESLGIEREAIIAAGDNENDISMIRFAGLGIAMGNGVEEIKAAADFITDTNDNDGLAKALRKFVLNQLLSYEAGN